MYPKLLPRYKTKSALMPLTSHIYTPEDIIALIFLPYISLPILEHHINELYNMYTFELDFFCSEKPFVKWLCTGITCIHVICTEWHFCYAHL